MRCVHLVCVALEGLYDIDVSAVDVLKHGKSPFIHWQNQSSAGTYDELAYGRIVICGDPDRRIKSRCEVMHRRRADGLYTNG